MLAAAAVEYGSVWRLLEELTAPSGSGHIELRAARRNEIKDAFAAASIMRELKVQV